MKCDGDAHFRHLGHWTSPRCNHAPWVRARRDLFLSVLPKGTLPSPHRTAINSVYTPCCLTSLQQILVPTLEPAVRSWASIHALLY